MAYALYLVRLNQHKGSKMRSKALIEKLVQKALTKLSTNNIGMNAEAIKEITKLVNEYGMGNCWGTTLWTMNAYAPNKFIDAAAMQVWLDRNTTPVTRPAFGDILVIHNNGFDLWNPKGELSHTAIRIGNGLYWHQQGFGGIFKVGSLKEVLRVYPGTYSFVRSKENVESVGDYREYYQNNKKAA